MGTGYLEASKHHSCDSCAFVNCTGQGNLCRALHDVCMHHLTHRLISCVMQDALVHQILTRNVLQSAGGQAAADDWGGLLGQRWWHRAAFGRCQVRSNSLRPACILSYAEERKPCMLTHWLSASSAVLALTHHFPCRGLEVYRTLLTKSRRIVFEVAVIYSQTSHTWKEMIRLWVSHRGINSYAASTKLLLDH